ncbi:MAG TPA: MMPL family transporter [Acidimicrobiales bacterium]|nr:MMPL family transporter [Acidimicrobiales bacterium]
MLLDRLARFVVRRHRLVLLASLAAFIVAAVVGGGVSKHLQSGGFEDPKAPSARAARLLHDHFGGGEPNLLFLVTAKSGNVDAPDVATAGTALTARLAKEPGVEAALSYWTIGSPPPLRGTKGDQAMVFVRVAGSDDQVIKRVKTLEPTYVGDRGPIVVAAGGRGALFAEVGTTIEKDLARAEGLAFPIILVVLIVVFGGLVAASLPLAIGVLAIIGTFFVLRLLTLVTDVSIFSLNLTTAMSLGLAVDYSLFVVSRFREELQAGYSVEDAVVRSMQTAGRTVLFSAATVAISLGALLIFPMYFLRSFAYAGIAVVAVASVGAVVVLPAMLAALGNRVGKSRRHQKPVGEGFWHRVAVVVMRRPLPIATAVVALLLFLGAPFLNIKFGLPDDRVLPKSSIGRQVNDQLRSNFSAQEGSPISVVAPDVDTPTRQPEAIDTYATTLSKLDGVARVDAFTGSYIGGQRVIGASPTSARFITLDGKGTWLSIVSKVEPVSPAGEHLIHEVRDTPAPFNVLVGGQSAQLVDSKASLFSRLPWAGLLIALVTFTVLFLMFGSVLVPAKAVVLNLLSLTATFGAMVWIFQEGHLKGFFNFTPTGVIDTTTPILMFCIAFGLSMDYEVFLLSRIKEEHDRGGDNQRSVAVGLEHTGRIVTAAAALLAIVFLAMTTSHVAFIKLFGLGLAMAVVMDATLIRGTLVPAFMRLAGDANWWAPAPLRRIYDRFGISESATLVPMRDELYRRGVVRAAKKCSSEDELFALLEEENLTVDELLGFGAPASLLQGSS